MSATYDLAQWGQPAPSTMSSPFGQLARVLADVLSKWRFNPVALVKGTLIEPVAAVVRRAVHEFAAVPRKREPRPRIVVAGEFYVRLDGRCNSTS